VFLVDFFFRTVRHKLTHIDVTVDVGFLFDEFNWYLTSMTKASSRNIVERVFIYGISMLKFNVFETIGLNNRKKVLF
jgi:hypothetical protein